jgi:hypothetical protein
MANGETLRAEVQRLITDSLANHVGKVDYTTINFMDAAALYKRQIERLGCTNVSVTAGLNDTHDSIDVECHFTPPPAPIFIEFTVQTKE